MRRLLLLLIATVLWSPGVIVIQDKAGGGAAAGGGAPSRVDSWTELEEGSGDAEPYATTATYTAAAGSNRIVLFAFVIEDGGTNCGYNVTTASFGNSAECSLVQAKAAEVITSIDNSAYLWYCLEADIPSGAHIATFTPTGSSCSADWSLWVSTWENVNQTTPVQAGATGSCTGTANDAGNDTIACSATITPGSDTATVSVSTFSDGSGANPPEFTTPLSTVAQDGSGCSGACRGGVGESSTTSTFTPTSTAANGTNGRRAIATIVLDAP